MDITKIIISQIVYKLGFLFLIEFNTNLKLLIHFKNPILINIKF